MDILDLVSFALLILLAYKERQWELRERAWALERAALITRIQHPEVYTPPAAPFEKEKQDIEVIEAPTDEIDLVGEVVGGSSDAND